MFAQVALPIPKRQLYTYSLPDAFRDEALPGVPVLVPFGRGTRVGLVWETTDDPPWKGGKIRPIQDVLAAEPLLDDRLRDLIDWMSRYYLIPIGQAVAAALPAALGFDRKVQAVAVDPPPEEEAPPALAEMLAAIRKRKKGLGEATLGKRFGAKGLVRRLRQLEALGLIRLEESWSVKSAGDDDPFDAHEPVEPVSPPILNREQEIGVQVLTDVINKKKNKTFLLQGVTGSGKTEVYFRAAEAALSQGRGVLVLVPEISLTPQLVGRFRARFSEPMAVLHSGLSEKARAAHWRRIKNGEARIVVGARSALFAPMPDPGLIVVDEEHDGSYRQDEGISYHARDMAVVRAGHAKAALVLGSATPSMESMANAGSGKYGFLTLTQRATGVELPKIDLIDLTVERKKMQGNDLLSPPLIKAVEEALAADKQALLFLNRRGYAPAVLCTACGTTISCPGCSVALTLHKRPPRLTCHYCDFEREVPDICPHCKQMALISFGPGTERLEMEVKERFPEAAVARLDRDTVSKSEKAGGVDLEKTLAAFTRGEIDILTGTQMIAKGHHFPNLALVGVVAAETSLAQPEFRAAERTFQLIAQVAGRAGREAAGKVLVQTYDVNHYAITAAAKHDVEAFRTFETSFRRMAGYPPFNRLALIKISSLSKEAGEGFCKALREALPAASGVLFLGPAPAPLFKLRSRFRWQVLVKEETPGRLHKALGDLIYRVEAFISSRIRLRVEVDPHAFL